jgi:hypothetical protein
MPGKFGLIGQHTDRIIVNHRFAVGEFNNNTVSVTVMDGEMKGQ